MQAKKSIEELSGHQVKDKVIPSSLPNIQHGDGLCYIKLSMKTNGVTMISEQQQEILDTEGNITTKTAEQSGLA